MLADDYMDTTTEITLLIGVDNYYKLVHPGFKKQGELILLPLSTMNCSVIRGLKF